ncbi:MAG: M28 family peptidase, partial [candidate division Zixibacteria bacterium]|nr:M28 family peptidase [candidate division Zixibacteria bacterium]
GIITDIVDGAGPGTRHRRLKHGNDIIDMDYPHWHTTQDTPDKCDSAAIADVGRVIAHVVYQRR